MPRLRARAVQRDRPSVGEIDLPHRALIAARPAADKLALPAVLPEAMEPAAAAAFVDFCQMLLNSNEFVYRN